MDSNKIETVVNTVLEDQNAFLVDLEIKNGNAITVFADTDDGITVQQLKMLNREMEAGLDRDIEDFALTVSSPGLDRPFTVLRQYKKNVGRWVKVKTQSQNMVIGKLEDATDDEIVLNIPPDRKKKQPAKKQKLAYGDIMETKIEIRF